MTPQMHRGLNALIDRFYRDEISEEEWALLQVHMAYCNSCEKEFIERKASEATRALERAARERADAGDMSD